MQKLSLTLLLLLFTINLIAQNGEASYTKPIKKETSYIKPIKYSPKTYALQQVQAFACAKQLDTHLHDYKLYKFDFKELYKFANSNNYVTEFKLKFREKSYLISLQRNDLRSPNYKSATGVTEKESKIIFERSILSDTSYVVKTFKGFVNGKTDNIARFTIDEDHFTGYIHDSETGEWIFFDSYRHFTKDSCGNEDVLVVYNVNDLIAVGGCQQVILETTETPLPQIKGLTDECMPRFLEIATEADFEFFQKYGNNSNEEIISVLNQTEGVYSYYFNLMLIITFQHVWENNNDPYTDEKAFERNNGEFFPYWQNNFSHIERDLSIMFSGYNTLKNSNGDFTVLGNSLTFDTLAPGTVCKHNITSIIVTNYSKVKTSAHEIGHALGMPHPFSFTPNVCNSDPGIMCYGNTNFFFNQSSIDATIDHLQNWGGCLNNIDPNNSQYSDWIKTWSNDRNSRWIGTWYLNNGDKKVVGDFDNDDDEEILFMSNSGWCNMIDYSCNQGSDWQHMWSNFGNGTIYTWSMNPNDAYFTGDFDGNGISELLSISHNSNWASLQEFNPIANNWSSKWSNFGNGKIETWNVNKSTDKFIIDDFTNDGKDDLLCISAGGKARLLTYNNSSFQTIWYNGGNNYLEGNSTAANSTYTYLNGDFDNNGTTDLLAFTGSWVTMIDFNTSTSVWNWKWSQWGANHFANMYILPLNSQQRMFSGNFDQDNKIEVLNLNNSWSATADWNGTTFQQNWNNGGTNMLSDWKLNTGYDNKYITVKATPHNEKHVLGIKYFSNGQWFSQTSWPEISNMYRSNEFSSKKKSDEQAQNNSPLNQILLYPNPTNDIVNIELGSAFSQKEITLTLFDIQGKKILSKTVLETKSEIDVSNLQNGFYILQISDKSTIIANHKIMIQ